MSEMEKHHAPLTPSGHSSDPEARHQPSAERTENSLAQLAYEFSVEISDILNAAALRLALFRWQPNGEHSDGDIVRLAKMLDRAGSLVRWLQDRSFAALEDQHRHGRGRASRVRKRFG
jgi:hypothetical protein